MAFEIVSNPQVDHHIAALPVKHVVIAKREFENDSGKYVELCPIIQTGSCSHGSTIGLEDCLRAMDNNGYKHSLYFCDECKVFGNGFVVDQGLSIPLDEYDEVDDVMSLLNQNTFKTWLDLSVLQFEKAVFDYAYTRMLDHWYAHVEYGEPVEMKCDVFAIKDVSEHTIALEIFAHGIGGTPISDYLRFSIFDKGDLTNLVYR